MDSSFSLYCHKYKVLLINNIRYLEILEKVVTFAENLKQVMIKDFFIMINKNQATASPQLDENAAKTQLSAGVESGNELVNGDCNNIAECITSDETIHIPYIMGYINNCKDNVWKQLTAEQLDKMLNDVEKATIVDACRKGDKAHKNELAAIIPMGICVEEVYKKYEKEWTEIFLRVPVEKRKAWLKKNKKKGSRTEWFLKPTQLFMVDIDHFEGDIRAELKRITNLLFDYTKVGLVYVTASGDGGRVICESLGGKSVEEDLQRFIKITGVDAKYIDDVCTDFSRISFLTKYTDVIYRDDSVLFATEHPGNYVNENYGKYELPTYVEGDVIEDVAEPLLPSDLAAPATTSGSDNKLSEGGNVIKDKDGNVYDYDYTLLNKLYLQMVNKGLEPKVGNRNKFLFEQSCDYRYVTDFKRDVLAQVLPGYGLSETEKMQCIDQALSYKIGHMSARMRSVMTAYEAQTGEDGVLKTALNYSQSKFDAYYLNCINVKRLPKSLQASFDSLSPEMYMPVLTLLGPIIGFLATNVRLDVHGEVKCLNLESYIEGFAGSGKGQMGKLYEIWCKEIIKQDEIYERQEEAWEQKKREAEGSPEQPKEIKTPRRIQTLRTTTPKIVQRLRDSKNQHILSFSPESDLLSINEYAFKQLVLILRYAYDNDTYTYDVKSVNSTNTTIKAVKWNIAICGTLDALYRLITNYTDGLLSRFCLAIMPDNRFVHLSRKHRKRSEKSIAIIQRVAHLLTLMQGDIEIPRIEDVATDWVNEVCDEAAKTTDTVMAELRIRTCVSAMRYTCCFMLLLFAEYLLKNLDDRGTKALPEWADGCETAEEFLKTHPDATEKFIVRFQTEGMKQLYRTLADYFIDNAIYLFRSKIEESSLSASTPTGQRKHRGANDAYLVQLPMQFTLDDCRTIRDGNDNAARMMIRNWLSQKTIIPVEGMPNTYQKQQSDNA